MTHKIFDFYSYLFQEEDNITAAYFKTNSDTEYRVYFYPIPEYFDILNKDSYLYKYGYFFGFTKLAPNEEKIEKLDFKIRNTILNIIKEFFKTKGIDKVLVFSCDDGDGRKSKRANAFNIWYNLSNTKMLFKKYDEEIIVIDKNGNKIDVEFMSLILENNNPKIDTILIEFQSFKEQLIASK